MSSINIQSKINHTKKLNHTFNSSKDEIIIYNKLVQIFNDIDVQHYDKDLYPFNCDFYIKDIDLYIEYQGTWTHGRHPYNKDDINDNKILEQLISKFKHKYDYYYNAIYTWTINDVKKRNIAKKNKLNYIEFFSMKEFNDWIKQYEL